MTVHGETSGEERMRDRFRGTIVGIAVGDALGGPLEFQPAREPADYVTDMIGGGWQQLLPGEWTDDTQLTLCVLESLLERKVFDPDDIARRFVQWMRSDPKDIGVHTGRVLKSIEQGESWEQASREAQEENPENAPNGSLMRSAPLALFFYRHPDFVATLSPVLSRITHAHPDCEFACVFWNVAITWLVAGHSVENAVQAAYEACHGASPDFLSRISKAMESRNTTPPTGWVLDTMEVALWGILHTNSFESALLSVVNRGEDADTAGAVAGAMAGARYGLSNIPERWLAPLKDRDLLIRYADSLLDLADSAG